MFHFPLQHVLEVRERLERLKQKEYSLVLLEWQKQVHEIDQRQQNVLRSSANMDSLRQSSPTAVPLQLHANFRMRMQAEISRLRQQVRETEQVLEAKRKQLVESRRSRRTLEILREKQQVRYEERLKRREATEMDEVAANYHTFQG